MLQSENEETIYLQNTLKQVKDTIEKLKEAKETLVKRNDEKNYQKAKAIYFEKVNQFLLREIQGVQNLKTQQESEQTNTTKDFVFYLTNLLQQNEKLYKENQELKIQCQIDKIQKKEVLVNTQNIQQIFDNKFHDTQINTIKQIYEKKIQIQEQALENALNLVKDQQNFYQDQILFFFEQFSQAHSLDFSIQLENMRQRFGIGKLEQRDLHQLEKDKITLQNYAQELQEENALIITNYNELVKEIRELKQQHQFRLNHRLYPIEFIKKNKEILQQKDNDEFQQNLAVYKKQQQIKPISSSQKKLKNDFSIGLYEQDLTNFYKRQTQFNDKKLQIFKQQKQAQEEVCKDMVSKLISYQQELFECKNENVNLKQNVEELQDNSKNIKSNFDNLQTVIFRFFEVLKQNIQDFTETKITQFKNFQTNVKNVMESINKNYQDCNINLEEFMIQFSSLNIQIYQDLSQKNLDLTQNNKFLEKTNDKLINQLLEIEKQGNQEILNQQIENFKDSLNTETQNFEQKINQIDDFIQQKKESLNQRQKVDNDKIMQMLKQDLEIQYNQKTNKYQKIIDQMKQKLQSSILQYEKRIENVKQKVVKESENLKQQKQKLDQEKRDLNNILKSFTDFKKKLVLKIQEYGDNKDTNVLSILKQIQSSMEFDGSLKDCIIVNKVFTQNIKGFVQKMENLGEQIENQCDDQETIQEYGAKVITYSQKLGKYINDLCEKFEENNKNLEQQANIQLEQQKQESSMQIEENPEQTEQQDSTNQKNQEVQVEQEQEINDIDYEQFNLNKSEKQNDDMKIEDDYDEDIIQNDTQNQDVSNQDDEIQQNIQQDFEEDVNDQNQDQMDEEEQIIDDEEVLESQQDKNSQEQNQSQEEIIEEQQDDFIEDDNNNDASQNQPQQDKVQKQKNSQDDPDYQPTEEEILQWKREQAYFQQPENQDDPDYQPAEKDLKKLEQQNPQEDNQGSHIAQVVVQQHEQEEREKFLKEQEEKAQQEKEQQDGKKLTKIQRKILEMQKKNTNKQFYQIYQTLLQQSSQGFSFFLCRFCLVQNNTEAAKNKNIIQIYTLYTNGFLIYKFVIIIIIVSIYYIINIINRSNQISKIKHKQRCTDK